MKNREKIRNISDNLINNTDIKYISHYRFENLEGMVYEEIEKQIKDCEPGEVEDIIENVYTYVLEKLETEKFKFIKYTLPQYKNILFNKQQ